MQFYGDNSELNGIWNAPIPDILLFGGIAIGKKQADSLRRLIIDFKGKYRSEADFPIKWNLKDLYRWYQHNDLEELYNKLLTESNEWRTSLIQASLSIDYKIIVAFVVCHSKKREEIKNNKLNIVKYAFCNALMRVGCHAKDINSSKVDVILDWPDGKINAPYTDEYRSAYYNGCSHASPVLKYFSGPLKPLGFNETPYFAKTEECCILQFTDIILGTTRELINYCLGRKTQNHLGVDLSKYLIPKYRGFPKRILGRGISVAPKNSELSSRLFKGLLAIRKEINLYELHK